MHYHFKVHKEEKGFWAECIEFEGCQSQGDTMEELKLNLKDALNLYLDEPANSKEMFKFPDDDINGKDIILIKADANIAFANYLRTLRLNHNMTQKDVARKLGYKSIWGYQKLESSKNANPELKTISKIKEIFPEFDINLVLV